MKRTNGSMDSAEAFGRLCAALDDPFADRAAILHAAELDEARLSRVRELWTARLADPEANELRTEFSRAYSSARSGQEPAPRAEIIEGVSPDVVAAAETSPAVDREREAEAPAAEIEVPTFMKEPARAPDISFPTPRPFTETTEVNLAKILGPSVPFDPSAPSRLPAPSAAAQVGQDAARREPLATGTTELDISSIVKPTIPFEAARSPGASTTPARFEARARSHEATPTETGAVDLRELFKPAVPFDPSAPSGLPAAGQAPPRIPPGHDSTETTELDLKALFDGPPVPFEKERAKPRTAALPAFAPQVMTPPAPTGSAAKPPSVAPAAGDSHGTAPRRRLIRFHPQTGEPLAVPYWQELPATEEKK